MKHILNRLLSFISFAVFAAVLGGLIWKRFGYEYVFLFAAGIAVVNLFSALRISTFKVTQPAVSWQFIFLTIPLKLPQEFFWYLIKFNSFSITTLINRNFKLNVTNDLPYCMEKIYHYQFNEIIGKIKFLNWKSGIVE